MIENRGFKLGRTRDANWVGDSAWAIVKTLGRIYGRRWVSFIYTMGLSYVLVGLIEPVTYLLQ